MISLAWFAHTWKLAERVKVAMGFRRKFSRGATSTFCLSFSGCWRCNENGRSQNSLLFLHYKENSPRKYALHSHLFWNLFQLKLVGYTTLPQWCTFCHLLQLLLNWRINVVIIVDSKQISLKWTWTINTHVCGSLSCLCWLNRTHFWNLLSELFSTLRLSEMLLLLINCLIPIFASTFCK